MVEQDDFIEMYEPYGLVAWVFFWILVVFGLPYSIFGVLIFFICKDYFERWSEEIGEKPTTPFFLVMFFGPIGQLGYYIHYKQKLKTIKEYPLQDDAKLET